MSPLTENLTHFLDNCRFHQKYVAWTKWEFESKTQVNYSKIILRPKRWKCKEQANFPAEPHHVLWIVVFSVAQSENHWLNIFASRVFTSFILLCKMESFSITQYLLPVSHLLSIHDFHFIAIKLPLCSHNITRFAYADWDVISVNQTSFIKRLFQILFK